jgi:predicted patatin/cPLA2 family phospholipase
MGALKQLRNMKKLDDYILYACSAGALSGVMVLLEYSDDEILCIYHEMVNLARNKIKNEPFKYNSYNMTPCHFKVFEKINKQYPNAYKIITKKKFYIGVTRQDKFKWYKKFKSNHELFNILLCSFHIPFLCSYNALINDIVCIDGTISINYDQHLPEDTLIICPKIANTKRKEVLNGKIPLKFCATPPSPEAVEKFYTNGMNDMFNFLKYNKYSNQYKQKLSELLYGKIPNIFWWWLRNLQPLDTVNLVTNI